MKRIVPWALCAVASGASCTIDLSGLPGETSPSGSSGGGSPAVTTSSETVGSSSATSGAGGATSATTGSTAASTSASVSSAASSSSSGGGPVWAHRRTLDLDLGGNGSVDDFPLLVLLDKSRIDYGATQDKGEDLRFTDMSDVPLDHEIELWDETFNSLVWVRIPTITQNGANHTQIRMYDGNAAAADGQKPAAVWSSNFVGVWHLNQPDGALADSSNTTGPATNHGSTRMPAMLGYGRDFSASDHEYIDTLNTSQPVRYTVEAWAKGNHNAYTGSGPNGPLMCEKNYQIMWDHTNPFVAASSLNTKDGNATGQNWKAADFAGLDGGTWYYLASVFAGDKLRAYKDGMKKDEKTFAMTDPQPETETAKIGRHAFNTGDANFFDGMVDEVRISKIVRSDRWIQAQNRSMRNAGFVNPQAEETGSFTLP
jgi:hypothetical protein